MNFLIDPFFAPKDYYPGFDFCPTPEMKKTRTPMVVLPVSVDEILKEDKFIQINDELKQQGFKGI